jgi:hypothetical protein
VEAVVLREQLLSEELLIIVIVAVIVAVDEHHDFRPGSDRTYCASASGSSCGCASLDRTCPAPATRTSPGCRSSPRREHPQRPVVGSAWRDTRSVLQRLRRRSSTRRKQAKPSSGGRGLQHVALAVRRKRWWPPAEAGATREADRMFSIRLDRGVTPARPRDAMQRPKLMKIFGGAVLRIVGLLMTRERAVGVVPARVLGRT